MKRLCPVLFALSLCGCSTKEPPTSKASLSYYPYHLGEQPYYMQLPPTPPHCETRVFYIKPSQFKDAPFQSTDWTDYFRSCGMTFPRGGFAAYYASCHALILCTTPQNLDLMEPIGSPEPSRPNHALQRTEAGR